MSCLLRKAMMRNRIMFDKISSAHLSILQGPKNITQTNLCINYKKHIVLHDYVMNEHDEYVQYPTDSFIDKKINIQYTNSSDTPNPTAVEDLHFLNKWGVTTDQNQP